MPSPRKMALIEGHGNLPSRSYCNHLRTEVAAGYKIEGSANGFSIPQVAEAVYAVFEHGHPTRVWPVLFRHKASRSLGNWGLVDDFWLQPLKFGWQPDGHLVFCSGKDE